LPDVGIARGFKNLSRLRKMATVMVWSGTKANLEGSLPTSGLCFDGEAARGFKNLSSLKKNGYCDGPVLHQGRS
jgi:hypothetical protein